MSLVMSRAKSLAKSLAKARTRPLAPLAVPPPISRPLRRLAALLHMSSVLQIAVLCGFWGVGEGLARGLHLPVPGGVVGMAVVLALLAGGWVRPASVRRGAHWLLAEMLLFFVPAVMAVLDHREFLGLMGLKVAAVILGGTVAVMTATALTVDVLYRWRMRHGAS